MIRLYVGQTYVPRAGEYVDPEGYLWWGTSAGAVSPLGGAPVTLGALLPAHAAAGWARETDPSAPGAGGITPRWPVEGFNLTRAQDPQKSAKDAFLAAAMRAPEPPPLTDRQALGGWFSRYIRPDLEALGHRVTGSGEDVFSFSNWQGDWDVDFARGAGAPGGALQWLARPRRR